MLFWALGLLIVWRWWTSWWAILVVGIIAFPLAAGASWLQARDNEQRLGLAMPDLPSMVISSAAICAVWAFIAGIGLAILKARARGRARAALTDGGGDRAD